MWQTKYASAIPKNLGVGVIFGRAVKAISSLGVRSLWVSRLQPQAACMERLLKPPRMVMPKKILTLIHYCALFDRFLKCSLKRPP